jgi:hypothetical protein
MRQSIQSILIDATKLGFVAEERWAGTRPWARISLTTLVLLIFAGGLFFGVLMLAPTRAPAAYQAHIAIKGKKQGQFVSPSGTKKPSTTGPAPTAPVRGR